MSVPIYTNDELIDKEREAGQAFGPFHRAYLLNQPRIPERIRRSLVLAHERPYLLNSRQYFMDTIAEGPVANLTALVATTIEALWPAAQYTPLLANSVAVGKTFRICAGGIMSFAATGTLTITPNVGVATGGATMGASVAQTTPGITTAQPWYLEFAAVIRTIGSAGTIIGTGSFQSNGTGTAGTGVGLTFGGTSAAIDTTSNSGITIGKTLSVAGTVTPQFVSWQALN